MDFGEVLAKAWRTIWKHKILWVFGILGGCGVNSGGSWGNGFQYQFNRRDFTRTYPYEFFNRTWQAVEELPAGVWIALATILVVVVLAAIFLSTVGRIGLILGTQRSDQAEGRITFGALFSGSLPFFWRVFALDLLAGLIGLLLVGLFLGVPITLAVLGGRAEILALFIPLFCLTMCVIVPVSWALGVFLTQSAIAMVVEKVGIGEGVRRGWNVIVHNFGAMLVMALILFLGAGLINFIISLPLLLLTLPLLAITLTTSNVGIFFVGFAALIVLYLPILLLASGIVTAYVQSAWTLTYLRLSRKAAPAPAPAPVPPPA